MLNDVKIVILSFYSFVDIENCEILLPKILLIGKKKRIKGTILLASEGFNGSISGNKEDVMLLLNEIIKLTSAININVKVNYADIHPFQKLKVKLKKEIITMGVGSLNIDELRGKYINTHDWDNFIMTDDVIVIDTRNDYEVETGCFKNAINPKTISFREFPNWAKNNLHLLQNKKVAMYCTGGIRCEKSTSYLKQLGFDQVYHLKGGILQYLEDTKNKNNLWKGQCFVFDDRITVSTEDL